MIISVRVGNSDQSTSLPSYTQSHQGDSTRFRRGRFHQDVRTFGQRHYQPYHRHPLFQHFHKQIWS